MSQARDRITEVLKEHVGCRLSEEHVRRLAHELMPIVQDAVARGFEKAADVFDGYLSAVPSPLLRQWAADARKDVR